MTDQNPKLAKIAEAQARVQMAFEQAQEVNLGGALLALENATKALKRIASRTEALPEEYERETYTQLRGPTVEFVGKLLCETGWITQGDQPLEIWLALFETRAGAYVAVSSSEPEGTDGFMDTRVAVIQSRGDQDAMRFEVMDHFNWDNRARSMVKEIGWDLRKEVP